MDGYPESLILNFFCRTCSRPAQHDCHAACHRTAGRQAGKGIGVDDPDIVWFPFQFLADNRRDQGFMALSGGRRAHGANKTSMRIDPHLTGFHEGGDLGRRVHQILKHIVAAPGFKISDNTDASKFSFCTKLVTPPDQIVIVC